MERDFIWSSISWSRRTKWRIWPKVRSNQSKSSWNDVKEMRKWECATNLPWRVPLLSLSSPMFQRQNSQLFLWWQLLNIQFGIFLSDWQILWEWIHSLEITAFARRCQRQSMYLWFSQNVQRHHPFGGGSFVEWQSACPDDRWACKIYCQFFPLWPSKALLMRKVKPVKILRSAAAF